MHSLIKALCITLALAAGFESVEAAPKGVFHPISFTLSNGLQVVIIPNHRAPVVEQAVWYKVGAVDENDGKSGIAHFLEHLMFKGTPKAPEGQFAELITRCGGNYNAVTTSDYTYYYEKAAVENLELIIKLEADRMRNLSLHVRDVDTERKVILEERRLRIDNSPIALLGEALNTAFYWHYPYRRPVIGWEHEMETLGHGDAREFYNAWYHPNNAIVIFAGDITPEKIRPLVEKYYGSIPAKPLPARKALKEPPHHGIKQRLELAHAQVKHPYFYRAYAAPNYRNDPIKAYALQVLAYVLTGGATGRLIQALVEDQKIADHIMVSYIPHSRGPAAFELSAQPARGRSLAEFEDALEREIKKLFSDDISEKEIQAAQRRLIASLGYIKDSAFGGIQEIGAALCTDQSITDIEAWPERIQAVTREQVNTVVRDIFGAPSFVTGVAHPLENKLVSQ